jgi:hypothetical protein
MANSEEEIWRAHPEYTGTEVSTLGRVRTLDRVVSSENGTRFLKGRVLKQSYNDKGYLKANIPIYGKFATKKVHRLVAQTFIHNPDNLPEVNHRDCDRANNNAGNLEWCTHQENIAYKDKLGHTARNNAPKSPVYAINLATLKILHFNSQSEAGEKLMVNKGHINSVIKGSRNQAGGFWFVNDDNNAADTIKQKLHEIKHRSTLKKYAI